MQGFIIEDEDGLQATIVARMCDFFKKSNQVPGRAMRAEYLGRDEISRIACDLRVFPNGCGKKIEGYVSIQFHEFDGTCIVSLVDADDTQRFSQSFTISYPENRVYTIEKYISHKQLLSDPEDFLPNGTMTLMISLHLTTRKPEFDNYRVIESDIFVDNFDWKNRESDCRYLFLDSPLAKRLSEESSVFRAMLESTMIENRRKTMCVHSKELTDFYDMGKLLMGFNPIDFRSIDEIFGMYILADKYDVPFVSETCTCFMKLYGYVHGVEELSAYVQEYVKIEHLKTLLETQVSLISHTNFTEEIDKTGKDVVFSKRPIRGCLWVYRIPKDNSRHYFHYERNLTSIDEPTKNENKEYDFYV